MAISISDRDFSFMGHYATPQEVWRLFPTGGATGQYVTIGGVRCYWDEWRNRWSDGTEILPPGLPDEPVEGDLSITGDFSARDVTARRDLRAGRDLAVAGLATMTRADVARLEVADRLRAKNVRLTGEISSDEYAGGMAGWFLQNDGRAELKSLSIREFLEVPELRYNRISVITGEQWNAPGGGIVEQVDVENETIALKLEEGEYAACQADDICKGIFHHENGFYTSFFRIVEQIDKSHFRYALRPGYPFHPQPAMHFVGYGSFSNKARQCSAYSTRSYTRYLDGVNDWEIALSMIRMQFGDLSTLRLLGIDMTGYSAYLRNIYMTGTLKQLSADGQTEVQILCPKGEWLPGSYYENDEVTHNGSLWWCVARETADEPDDASAHWQKRVSKGNAGVQGEPGDRGEPGAPGLPGIQGAAVRMRGKWDATAKYERNGSFVDVVVYGDHHWHYVVKDGADVPVGALPTNGVYWDEFNEFQNIATGVLLAENAWIDILDTNGLRIGTEGWELTAGAIVHCKSGLALTADGLILAPAGGIRIAAGGDYRSVDEEILAARQAADEAKGYIEHTLPGNLAEIQRQIDGQIDSWFFGYTPALHNYPACEWPDPPTKNRHVGDTFTNTQPFVDNAATPDAGKSWRFVVEGDVYNWTPIADSDAVKALLEAAKARDTADGKRRVFVVQPAPPYDRGDLWSQGPEGDLMVCRTAKSAGSYSADDWQPASQSPADIAKLKADLIVTDRRITAQVTAFDEYGQQVKRTGIDVESGTITLDADRTTVTGDLLAEAIKTNGFDVNGRLTIDATGRLTGTDVSLTGTIDATGGTIGGLSIRDGGIQGIVDDVTRLSISTGAIPQLSELTGGAVIHLEGTPVVQSDGTPTGKNQWARNASTFDFALAKQSDITFRVSAGARANYDPRYFSKTYTEIYVYILNQETSVENYVFRSRKPISGYSQYASNDSIGKRTFTVNLPAGRFQLVARAYAYSENANPAGQEYRTESETTIHPLADGQTPIVRVSTTGNKTMIGSNGWSSYWGPDKYFHLSQDDPARFLSAKGVMRMESPDGKNYVDITDNGISIVGAQINSGGPGGNFALESWVESRFTYKSEFDTHVHSTAHITSGDRTLWNNKLDATLYTPADVLAKLKTVDGIGSGLDADRMNARTFNQVAGTKLYTYASDLGGLIKTDIPKATTAMVFVELWGNSYLSGLPVNTQIQFYNYNAGDNIVGASAINAGYPVGNITVYFYNDLLQIHFPRTGSYNTLFCRVTTSLVDVDRVTSFAEGDIPAGISRSAVIAPVQAWHAGNFDPATKVNKSGDTMTGVLDNLLSLNSVSQSSYLSLLVNGHLKANVGWTPANGAHLYNAAVDKSLEIGNNGVLTYGVPTAGNTVWHAGNDGAGSGLDADLFRGRTPDEFKGNFLHTIDASALDQDTYYPVTLFLGAVPTVRISVVVALNSGTKPAWSTHGAGFSVRFIEEVNGCGWGTSLMNRTVFVNSYYHCERSPIGRVYQMPNASMEVIWVRGGGRYHFYLDTELTVVLRTEPFSMNGDMTIAPMTTPLPHLDLYNGEGAIGVGDLIARKSIGLLTSAADTYLKIATDSREWWAGVGAASGDDHFVIYDKTAQKHRLQIDTAGNVSVGTYVSGLFGTGINLAADTGEIECTKLFVRGSLVSNELVANQLSATNGALIVSDSVELIGDAIRDQNNSWNITQSAIKGGVDSGFICPFVVGDYIRCQKWTNDHTALRSYFAKVVWANPTSFTLPGDIEQPKAGDVIVRWNSDHQSRKGLLYLTSSDTNAPYMEVVYNGAAVMRLGNLTGFDGLTGYGIAYPGKFHLSSGGTARISGWNFDSEELYWNSKTGLNAPSVSMYAKSASRGFSVWQGSGNSAGLYYNRDDSFGIDICSAGQYIFQAGKFNKRSGLQIGVGDHSISYDTTTGRMAFGAAVSLNWNTPINSITTALGGLSYSKLTKIDANGIYTGTLTADQITTGYLSAARIAAGTITTEKLQAGLVLGEDAIFSGSIKIGDVFNVDKNGTGNWGILSVNDKNVQINRADGAGVFLFNTSLPSVADFAGQQQNGYFVAEINDAYDSIIPTTVTGVVGQFVVTPGEPIGRSKLITFAAPTTASNLIFSMRQFEADMPIRVTLRIKIQRQIGANWEDIATFYNRSFSSSGQNSPYMFTDTALGGKCVAASGDTIRMAYEIRYDKAIGAYGAFGVTLQARGNPVCSYTYAVSSLLNSVSVYPDGLAYIKSTDRHFHISGAGAIDKLSLSAWVSDFNLRIGPGLKIYSLDADGKNHLCVGGIYTATVNSPTSSPLPADKTIRLVRCSNFLEYVNKKPDSYIFIATTM